MKNILIIDDHTEIRENIAEILQLAGYATSVADNGKKGLEMALKENAPPQGHVLYSNQIA